MNRYEKYKDSGIAWIGEIPEGWSVRKGKHLFHKQDRNVREEDGIVTCFRDGQVTLRSNRRTDGFTTAMKEVGYQGIRKGDLVIHNMDAFAGAIGVSDSDGKSTPVYSACTPISETNANVYYYCYLLRSFALNGVILSLAKGIRERSTDFRFKDFGELTYHVPPIAEQEAIAEFLDGKCEEVDRLVGLQQAMIEELVAYKQSVITECVTKGLDPSAPLRDSGIPWISSIPAHWETGKLSTSFFEHKFKNIDLRENNLLSLSYGKIVRKNINTAEGLLPQSFDGYNIINDGDIVFRLTDLQNDKKSLRTGLCKERGIITSAYITIRKRGILNIVYYHYLLSSYDLLKVYYGLGDGIRQGMNFNDLKKIILITPPLHEQQAIADHLDRKCEEIDNLIAIKREKIEQLKEYKKSIIFEYVTGKKRVMQ